MTIQASDSITALAASSCFERDGICFAARESGLYRSDDGGVTWRPMFASLGLETPTPTTAVALAPDWSSDQRVFVGVKGGILRSWDGGASWLPAVLPPPPPLVTTLVVSPNFAEDGIVLAGTMEDGIFRSADRGNSWASWNFGLLDLGVLSMAISPDFAHDETIFAGTETGLFRSTNGGLAWRETPFPGECAPVLSLALSPGYARDGVIFAGTEAAGLFASSDGGDTWSRRGKQQIAEAVNAVSLSPDFPAHPDMLVLLSDAVLVSGDAGASWSARNTAASLEDGTTALVAPLGVGPAAPLLVGLVSGGVARL